MNALQTVTTQGGTDEFPPESVASFLGYFGKSSVLRSNKRPSWRLVRRLLPLGGTDDFAAMSVTDGRVYSAKSSVVPLLLVILVLIISAARAAAPDWAPPTTDAVRASAMAWFEKQDVDQAARKRAEAIWSGVSESSTGADRLAALAMTFALADRQADKLVRFCAAPRSGIELPEAAWLDRPETQPLVSANLRLLVGRWLVHESLYDEALEQLAGLEPRQVVDPASLLFYQAVARHRLLRKQEGLDVLDRLLHGPRHSPRRYTALARLMQEDLEGLDEDTLDHVARRMQDVGRRLDLGRAGSKVRKIEDGVIESLDKLIEELEKQQQKQCQGNAGNNLQPSRPAQDSRLMGGRGPGRVTRRKLGSKSGWGNLPPKQREEALQEVGRQFPSHYRDVIEQYFRKMAGEKP